VPLFAQSFWLHLPWWLYFLVAAGIVVRVSEERLRVERKAGHRSYLRSATWRTKRRGALARAGGCCEDCGSRQNLHVHHLTYRRHGREEDRDLRVLCARCHRRRHRDGGRTDDAVDSFIGWLES
jgi:5-methylcytosine-specific restriction endonuclease McrA